MKNKDVYVEQKTKILIMLMFGFEIDLTMTPFTTKLSTRLGECERDYNLKIVRGWKKLSRFVHPVRTYKLKSI